MKVIRLARLENINRFNVVKNAFQFLMGVALFHHFVGITDPYGIIVGLVGFVIAYHSVYHYNDMMDYDEDSKQESKRATKKLARGDISRELVESKFFMYMLTGLSISYYFNIFFGLMVSVMLLLNFLHSSHITRFKKSILALPNLFIIESLKFAIGWVALAGSLNSIPIFVVFAFSIAYTLSYSMYKKNAALEISKRDIVSAFLVVASYILSLVLYDIQLALIGIVPVVMLFLIMFKYDDTLSRFRIGSTVGILSVVGFIIILYLLPQEPFSMINSWLGTWLKV